MGWIIIWKISILADRYQIDSKRLLRLFSRTLRLKFLWLNVWNLWIFDFGVDAAANFIKALDWFAWKFCFAWYVILIEFLALCRFGAEFIRPGQVLLVNLLLDWNYSKVRLILYLQLIHNIQIILVIIAQYYQFLSFWYKDLNH